MARLDPSKRASLPDSAFAYVDSRGRRRLPIHDEAHVRNALARFNQVRFESDLARERARKRLLNAAKKYGIMPLGFITGQLRAEQGRASTGEAGAASDAGSAVGPLPTGFVTLLMTDIERSTEHVGLLGERYEELLRGVRDTLRDAVTRTGGRVIDARGDEVFAVFEDARQAVSAAVAMQRGLREQAWPAGLDVRVRAGLHSGNPMLTAIGYIGLAVHTAARVCTAAHGGQVVVSGQTRRAMGDPPPDGISLRPLGAHRLHGLPEPEALFQVVAAGLLDEFPPPRTTPPGPPPTE
ncbi:MAG: adenylate/guanylate cyclase domain-containing protein [Gemmatimonadetes bacterium]|nr:adenylate/guanylate cyclase domain-containing protein [Gemmatimonadota bacterium]